MSVLKGTRARVILISVVALAMLAILPIAAQSATDRFDDVPESNIFYDDIEWMAEAGITRGCNPEANTMFCPEDDATRQELAAFFHRYHLWAIAQPGVVGPTGPAGPTGADGADGATGPTGPAGGGGGGAATAVAISYLSPTATSDGAQGPFLVATKTISVPADGGGIIATATASATPTGSGNSKDVSGRVWVEIGGDGSCTSQADAHTAWFAYNSDDDARHGTRDMTAIGTSGASTGDVRVDVCTDGTTDEDGSWNLTGNTAVQWVGSWS